MTVPQDYGYLHYSCLTYSQAIVISHAQTLRWTGSVNHPYMESESCYRLNINSILISTFNHRVSIHNINLLPAPPSYIALLPLHFCEVFLYLLLDSQALLEPLHQFLFIWWHLAKLQLNSCSRSLKVCFQRASSCLVPISHVFFQLLCLQQLPSSSPSLGNPSSEIIVVLFLDSFQTQFTIVCKYNLNISI